MLNAATGPQPSSSATQPRPVTEKPTAVPPEQRRPVPAPVSVTSPRAGGGGVPGGSPTAPGGYAPNNLPAAGAVLNPGLGFGDSSTLPSSLPKSQAYLHSGLRLNHHGTRSIGVFSPHYQGR